jgi:hypothetical protein
MNNQPLTKDELLGQVDSITNKWSEVQDILKRPLEIGLPDLIQWVKRNGTNFEYSLDDLRSEIELGYPIYPVEQKEFKAS